MSVERVLTRHALAALEEDFAEAVGKEGILCAFFCWANKETPNQISESARVAIQATVKGALAKSGADLSYIDVGILGYAMDLGLLNSADQISALSSGLDWMISRPSFDAGVAPSFELSGVALLGMALGASYSEAKRDTFKKWIESFIKKSVSLNIDDSERTLLVTATAIIDSSVLNEIVLKPPFQMFQKIKSPLAAADPEIQKRALVSILEASASQGDALTSAILYCNLRWMLTNDPKIDFKNRSIEDVLTILGGIGHGLKRWPWGEGGSDVCWDIRNEYHVQSLLWSVLAPIFPDLEDEEYLGSLGFKHPRADLCIPSLKLIIEVKFIYSGTNSDFGKIEAEIAQDSAIYFSKGSPFDRLIAVVWDNTSSVEKHQELKNGLAKLERIAGTVILARPGKMNAPRVSNLKRSKSNAPKGQATPKNPNQTKTLKPATRSRPGIPKQKNKSSKSTAAIKSNKNA